MTTANKNSQKKVKKKSISRHFSTNQIQGALFTNYNTMKSTHDTTSFISTGKFKSHVK